jgi:extracellular matrix regulatory protein A
MRLELLHVGFGGVVAANRILAVASPDSSPIKRLVRTATEQGIAINMAHGRKTKSVIVLDSGHVVLAALQPETITSRLRQQREKHTDNVTE